MKILIKNANILTMKDENILYGYNVVIDEVIVYIGQNIPNNKYDKIIDATNMILMPGLINMHSHIAMSLFRGIGIGTDLNEWLNNNIWPLEKKLTDNDVYSASQLSCLEMISGGITCFNDMYMKANKIAEAVISSKLRACLAQNYFSEKNLEKDIEFYKQNENLIKDYNNIDNRIKIFLGPHSIYTCSLEYLKFLKEQSKKYNTLIHIHVSETEKEVQDCLLKYNMTPVELLDSSGFLDEYTIAAHCIHLSSNDINILAKNKVNVVTNTSSNLILGSGICQIDKLLNNNINVCIGTDGPSSNNNLNMFEELHLTAMVLKGIRKDPTILKAYEILKMATINAAKALKLDDKIGTIEINKEADIILIDMNKPHLIPNNDIINNLIYSVQSSDVYLTMVKGNILYENGIFTTLNKNKIYQEIDMIRHELLKK